MKQIKEEIVNLIFNKFLDHNSTSFKIKRKSKRVRINGLTVLFLLFVNTSYGIKFQANSTPHFNL